MPVFIHLTPTTLGTSLPSSTHHLREMLPPKICPIPFYSIISLHMCISKAIIVVTYIISHPSDSYFTYCPIKMRPFISMAYSLYVNIYFSNHFIVNKKAITVDTSKTFIAVHHVVCIF